MIPRPIARSVSEPVRGRPPTVAARVCVFRDEAGAALEGAGAGDADGSAEGSALGEGDALGDVVGAAEGSALGIGAGVCPPRRVSPMISGLWSEER